MELKDIQLRPLLETLRLEKISDETYFSSTYSHYVSNSRLGLINPRQQGDPDKFFKGFQSSGYNPSFLLGTIVHSQVLQPEYFELSEYIGKPTAKLGAMADELFPIYCGKDITDQDIINASNKIEYYKGKMTSSRIEEVRNSCKIYWENRKKQELDLMQDKEVFYADAKMTEVAKSCIESLKSNKKVMDLLHPKGLITDPISECEQAILLDVEVICPNSKKFILHLKSKLDNFTVDEESNTIVVNDVKTLGKILSEFNSNVVNFHYNREIAMYLYLLKLVAEKFYNMPSPKIQANYLVVSTIPNFYSKVVPVTYNNIREGFHEFKTLLKYVAYNIGYKGYTLDGPNERSSKFQL